MAKIPAISKVSIKAIINSLLFTDHSITFAIKDFVGSCVIVSLLMSCMSSPWI